MLAPGPLMGDPASVVGGQCGNARPDPASVIPEGKCRREKVGAMDQPELNLGQKPIIDARTEKLIRPAFDQVLTCCARLVLFSTGKPTKSDGPVSERQEQLALDDLANFGYSAGPTP